METFPTEGACIGILFSLLRLQNENWEGKLLGIFKFIHIWGHYLIRTIITIFEIDIMRILHLCYPSLKDKECKKLIPVLT